MSGVRFDKGSGALRSDDASSGGGTAVRRKPAQVQVRGRRFVATVPPQEMTLRPGALDGAGRGLQRRREFRSSSGSDPEPAISERGAIRLAAGESRRFPNALYSAVTLMRRNHVPVFRKATPVIRATPQAKCWTRNFHYPLGDCRKIQISTSGMRTNRKNQVNFCRLHALFGCVCKIIDLPNTSMSSFSADPFWHVNP